MSYRKLQSLCGGEWNYTDFGKGVWSLETPNQEFTWQYDLRKDDESGADPEFESGSLKSALRAHTFNAADVIYIKPPSFELAAAFYREWLKDKTVPFKEVLKKVETSLNETKKPKVETKEKPSQKKTLREVRKEFIEHQKADILFWNEDRVSDFIKMAQGVISKLWKKAAMDSKLKNNLFFETQEFSVKTVFTAYGERGIILPIEIKKKIDDMVNNWAYDWDVAVVHYCISFRDNRDKVAFHLGIDISSGFDVPLLKAKNITFVDPANLI